MIQIKGLHKYYNQNHILKGIDLEIKKGESVVIIGPSGSGKSTLLKCINGLELFQEGEIAVEDTVLHSVKRKRPPKEEIEAIYKIRRKVGMVFQQFNLFPHMNVLENIIEAPLRVLKISREIAIDEAKKLLSRVNLTNKMLNYPEELSGGEQQRVAIVRTLAMKPEAILFDEPTSSLDPEMVGEVLSVIKDLVYEGMTTFISTHEMNFAKDVADKVVFIDKGEIVEIDTPENIFSNPKAERTRSFLSRVLSR